MRSHLAKFLISSRLGVGLAWAGGLRSINYKGPWLSTVLNSKNDKGSTTNSTVAVIYSIGWMEQNERGNNGKSKLG